MSPDFLDPDEDTEPPTRKLEDDVDGHPDAASTTHPANNPSLGDQSSILSRDDSHPAVVVGSDDLVLQKLRIGQLKKLRKEMRKLEKLDKIRLRRAEEQGEKRESLTEIQLLKQIMVLSDDSSVSTATARSSISALVAPNPSSPRGIEGQSASGSDNKKSSPKTGGSGGGGLGAIEPVPPSAAAAMLLPPSPVVPDQTKIKQQTERGGKRKPSVASVKEFCKAGGNVGGPTAEKDRKTNTYGSSTRAKQASPAPPASLQLQN